MRRDQSLRLIAANCACTLLAAGRSCDDSADVSYEKGVQDDGGTVTSSAIDAYETSRNHAGRRAAASAVRRIPWPQLCSEDSALTVNGCTTTREETRRSARGGR